MKSAATRRRALQLLALALVAGACSRAPHGPAHVRLVEKIGRAEHVWPRISRPELPLVRDKRVELGPQARADWLASTLPAQCRITLSDAQRWPWGELCPVLLHEYGHLAGYRDPRNPLDPHHASNPNSIMWAFAHADARCARRGLPYLKGSRRKGGTPRGR